MSRLSSLLLGQDGQVSLVSTPSPSPSPVDSAPAATSTPAPDTGDEDPSYGQMPFAMPGIQAIPTSSVISSPLASATTASGSAKQTGQPIIVFTGPPSLTTTRVPVSTSRASTPRPSDLKPPLSMPNLPPTHSSSTPVTISTSSSASRSAAETLPSSSSTSTSAVSPSINIPLIIAIVFTSIVVLATLGASLSWLLRFRRKKEPDEEFHWTPPGACPATVRPPDQDWNEQPTQYPEKHGSVLCAPTPPFAFDLRQTPRPREGPFSPVYQTSSPAGGQPTIGLGLGLGIGHHSTDRRWHRLDSPTHSRELNTTFEPVSTSTSLESDNVCNADLERNVTAGAVTPYASDRGLGPAAPPTPASGRLSPYSRRLPDGDWEDINIAADVTERAPSRPHSPSAPEGWGMTLRSNLFSAISSFNSVITPPSECVEDRLTALSQRTSNSRFNTIPRSTIGGSSRSASNTSTPQPSSNSLRKFGDDPSASSDRVDASVPPLSTDYSRRSGPLRYSPSTRDHELPHVTPPPALQNPFVELSHVSRSDLQKASWQRAPPRISRLRSVSASH